MMMIEASLKTYSDEELECLLIQADEEGDSQLLSMIEDEQIDREDCNCGADANWCDCNQANPKAVEGSDGYSC